MIPKRAVGALLSTALGLVLLLSFKTPETAGVAALTGTDRAVVDQPVGRTSQPATGAHAKSGYADGTVTGQVVSTRYGDVQVEVTISGGAISDVNALQLPGGDGHSARISNIVEPMLRSAALQAQSANIDLVSGATYTSTAYRESLQSALDAAAR
ncbi:MAG: FMN-binding protein [Chloroflexota bacterium]